TASLPKWRVLEELNRYDIPCGPILSTREIIEDASLAANDMIVEVEHPERGTFTTVGNPLKLSDSPTTITTPPLLGQHNQEIYIDELGLTQDELPQLKAQGVI
ncbi:CoA transferase, partial [Streptomyces griseorubiginosus]